MSETYFIPPTQPVDGDTAQVRDVNEINDATDAAFILLEDSLETINEDLVIASAQAKAWAVGPGDTPDQDNEVEPGLYSSSKYAENSSISATASSVSAGASSVSAGEALASEVASGISESNSTINASTTSANVLLTNADAVTTNANVVSTNADVVATGLDAVSTNADRSQTELDRAATEADATQTALDRVSTTASALSSSEDATQTALDRVATGLDATATSEDATQTALDRVATGLDVVQTALDRVQTGIDAGKIPDVSTGNPEDVIKVNASGTAYELVEGGTGGGTPPPEVQIVDFTILDGSINYLCDVSLAPITATLPTSPAVGDLAFIGDYEGSCGVTNSIYLTSTDLIHGSTEDFRITASNCCLVLQYIDATMGWKIVDGIGEQNSETTEADVKAVMNASGDAPVYACRAWVNFDGTGTVAIRASGNVSSITDNGVGDYTMNFITSMQDANYSPFGLSGDGASTNRQVRLGVNTSFTEASLRFRTGSAGAYTDDQYVNMSIFR